MSLNSEQAENTPPPQQVKPLYVTVFMVPIVGTSGTIQSRSLVFARPPTKEMAINTVMGIHEQSQGSESYRGEWARCADTLAQVPEELFAQMNQRRARKITHMVSITTADGVANPRLLSARSCYVHGWSREQLDRMM